MPFFTIPAVVVSVAASAASAQAQRNACRSPNAARAQSNPLWGSPPVRDSDPAISGGFTRARPDATADLFRHKPTAKVMADLRADARSEQNTALVTKCALALVLVVAVWIGVVLWRSSVSPEPVPSAQLER